MNDKSKEIEEEIKNVIELMLHLDKNILNVKKKEEDLKLSKNSKDIIKEFLESKKMSDFLCYDEKIKKTRKSIGIIKAINSMLYKDKDKSKNKKNKNIVIVRKINPTNFNQSNLYSNLFYYGAEAEYYFIHNIIKSKILEIVKTCFEHKFIKKEKEAEQNKNKSINNKNNFILISSNNLKKAKLRNRYYNSLINKSNNNIFSMKNYCIRTNMIKFYDNKNINNSAISIFDNSIKNINTFKNNSCINLMNTFINKNSSLTKDKCTNANLKYSTVDISKGSWKKGNNKNRNIILLNKKQVNEMEKSFMPLLYLHDFKYKKDIRFKPKKIPSFSSGMMELIHYNTKNNIKMKAEEEFLNECLRETYVSLRKINSLYDTKYFVDFSKNNSIKNNNDIYFKNNYEIEIPKEKKHFYGFEYKNIYKYSFNGKLSRAKKK